MLSELQHSEDLDGHITFPNPEDPIWMHGVAERAKYLRQQTDNFVTMRMVCSHGPFQTACDLR
jgi:hypothetical protein